jgi:hypothetical protein
VQTVDPEVIDEIIDGSLAIDEEAQAENLAENYRVMELFAAPTIVSAENIPEGLRPYSSLRRGIGRSSCVLARRPSTGLMSSPTGEPATGGFQGFSDVREKPSLFFLSSRRPWYAK